MYTRFQSAQPPRRRRAEGYRRELYRGKEGGGIFGSTYKIYCMRKSVEGSESGSSKARLRWEMGQGKRAIKQARGKGEAAYKWTRELISMLVDVDEIFFRWGLGDRGGT